MRIGLFIPCYIDAFFPEVGIATLELLERFSHDVHYPRDQTCCGQPMANSGFNAECANTEALFVRNFSGFDYVVSPYDSCGTLRRLKHALPSELHEPFFSKPIDLLSKVDGIEFVRPARPDECCGFGGTFSVVEEVVSKKMGYDKVRDHAQAGAEYIVSADSSCLMHQRGCAERIGVPMKFIHIAEILNGASA